MAKQRPVNTKFWDDKYVTKLTSQQKLVFLYLLTNPLTNLCGIYEIELSRMSFDTGLEEKLVKKILKKFEDDEKIYYIDERYIFLKNHYKHLRGNPSVEKGVEREVASIPDDILTKVREIIQTVDSLTTDCDIPILRLILIPILNSKELSSAQPDGMSEHEMITNMFELFQKTINPTINYGHKTNRKAVVDLIKIMGYDKAMRTAEYSINVQGEKYAPVITTPYQLKNKLSELIIYYRKQNKPAKGKDIIGL